MEDKSSTNTTHTQDNRNELGRGGTADGLKTGHTDEGGYGLCASAEHDGRRVIVVLNGMPTSRDRAEEGERLMSWAFANFEDVKLYAAGDVVDNAPVWLGTSPTVPLVGDRDLVVTVPHGWRKDAKLRINYASPIRAPVAKGAILGTPTLAGQGVPSMQLPLVTVTSVAQLGPPRLPLAVLTHYVSGG